MLPKIARELAALHAGPGAGDHCLEAGFGYRELMEALPTAVYAVDASGRIVMFNEAAAVLWGRRPKVGEERWCGAHRVFRRDGSPLPVGECPIALALQQGHAIGGVEVVVERPDGVRRHVMSHPRPLRDDAGRIVGAVNLLNDVTDHRAPQEKLRAREAQLRFIGSNAPMFLAQLDREGRFQFVSKACAERWGRSPAEMIGRTFAEVAGAAVWKRVWPHVQRVLAGETVEFELEVEHPTLGRRLSRETYSPEFATDGGVCGWLTAGADITDRWRAERALRESEARLKLAMQSGKLGIWDWDILANHVTWTESLYDIHGVKPGDFAPTVEGVLALVHPEDRGPVQRAVQSSLEHDVPFELEYRAVRPGGAIVWVFANAIVLREKGRPVRMLGALFDITARKQAEVGLRESETRFRALASHAPVGIFLTDTNGHALFVNDAWRALAGRTLEQVRGEAWVNALHPDDRERVTSEWYAAVQQRKRFSSEYRFQRPDGSVSWLQGSAVEYRSASGALLGYIGTVVDLTQRKAAEDALRDSEQRFRTLSSHAPVGIFLTDPQGETVFVNESWCAMSGLSPEEARGRGWARAMHPEDRARVAAEWAEALAENRSSTAEYRFVRADGTITWVQGNAVQLHDDAGRLVGYIGTVADFSRRKEAEERLGAHEAQLRLITTNAPIMLAHCDRELRYLFVNRAYAERFNREPHEIIGRTVPEMLGDVAHAALRPHIERALRGESVTFEIEVPFASDGVSRFLRAAYAPDFAGDGSVRGLFAAISDLTERRRIEIALRESEARFRQLADSMPQIVFAADAAGVVDYQNRRWYELTGAAEGVSGDESFLPVLHPDDRQRCLDTWYACVRSGEPYQIEYRFRFRERDEYRWHLGRALPVRDENGCIVRWFGTCTDIHDWKLVQDELRGAQRQLQEHADELERRVAERTASLREAISQMEEFSYSVSHDLRAPLRAMNAYAQALLEDYGPRLDDTARNYLARIQRSSVRMENLTRDVLTYSRVARAEVELRELNLGDLLHDVIVQYRELQRPAAEVEIVAPLPAVRGHESSLGQCFANLLTNAAKFVEPGVTPRIRIRAEPAGQRVRVWIEDNGIGIAPEYQARLFRVFERVPTRHAYEGTGIGLAIVRKAVEKMGGACGVVSDGRNGSRFWIELLNA